MISRRKKRAARTILLGVLAGTGVLHGMELTNPKKIQHKTNESPGIEQSVKKIDTLERRLYDTINFGSAMYATWFALQARRRHLEKKKAERKKRQYKRLGKVFE